MGIKIGIIGCGQIIEAHINEIKLIPQTELIAVCDLNQSLAADVADRFDINHVYTDYLQMINEMALDVIHITTPPDTHYKIGATVLKKGIHAYIEKPFCLNSVEARKLIDIAIENRVIACAGFSQLFDIAALKLRDFVNSDAIGDIVHIETYYGNSLDGNFEKLFLNNPDHWVHKLPGKLFQNIISHALYHITPFIEEEVEQIKCFTLDRSNNGMFFDELRVMLHAGKMTGYITFTSSVKPVTQFLRIYGEKSIAEIDFTNHTFCYSAPTQLPGPFARVGKALNYGKQSMSEGFRHAKQMWKGEDRFFAGMGGLFAALYDNIRSDKCLPPVNYSEVLKVSSILDEIGRQCQDAANNYFTGSDQ